ncbi:unnamed protein product, partial [Meganyctiphanes norvegica]
KAKYHYLGIKRVANMKLQFVHNGSEAYPVRKYGQFYNLQDGGSGCIHLTHSSQNQPVIESIPCNTEHTFTCQGESAEESTTTAPVNKVTTSTITTPITTPSSNTSITIKPKTTRNPSNLKGESEEESTTTAPVNKVTTSTTTTPITTPSSNTSITIKPKTTRNPSNLSCKYNNKIYKHGDKWKDGCMDMSCSFGKFNQLFGPSRCCNDSGHIYENGKMWQENCWEKACNSGLITRILLNHKC